MDKPEGRRLTAGAIGLESPSMGGKGFASIIPCPGTMRPPESGRVGEENSTLLGFSAAMSGSGSSPALKPEEGFSNSSTLDVGSVVAFFFCTV